MNFSFLPKEIYSAQSKINGRIKVCEQFGKYSLIADGLIQSGGIVSSIWSKPISSLKTKKIKNILILGLGGGTVIDLLLQKYPEAKFTGVEIDEKIIFIAKKFFNLGNKDYLEIVNENAFVFCKKQEQKFDRIIIDLYKGSKRPSFFVEKEFLESIKKRLDKNGVVVFNWLKIGKDSGDFENNLKKIFLRVDKVNTRTNMFFLARS